MDIEGIFLRQMRDNLLSMISNGSFTSEQEKDLKLAKYYIQQTINSLKEDSHEY